MSMELKSSLSWSECFSLFCHCVYEWIEETVEVCICACTFTHSSISACISALCVYACASTTWWHLNQLLAGSKASRALLCPASVSSGFKGDTTGTVPHPGSTGRAFISQICPPWASPLSPPAPSTGTPFIRALPLSTQTFKTHREGFTRNELCSLIASFLCCLRCFGTERRKRDQTFCTNRNLYGTFLDIVGSEEFLCVCTEVHN